MKKWITTYTPLMLTSTKRGNKLLYLPAGSVVDSTGEIVEMPDGVWERVILTGIKNFVGWVENRFLEAYQENYDKDCVNVKDIQTPNPSDAEQYVLWKKYKQVNLCGELCVSYLLGISLSKMLAHWEIKTPSFFKRVFGSGMARGTSAAELLEMFSLFDVPSMHLSEYLKSYTPAALQTVANSGVITSCKIDGITGRLRGQGVGHWVVVNKIEQERTAYGIIELYNPFPNRIERYSWAEFTASARVPYGAIRKT